MAASRPTRLGDRRDELAGGRRLVVDDVVDAPPAALEGGERAAGRIVDMGRRDHAGAVADHREHPPVQDLDQRLRRARAVETAVADDDAFERRLEHGALEEPDRGERLASAP